MKLKHPYFSFGIVFQLVAMVCLAFSATLQAKDKKLKIATVEYLPYYGEKLLDKGPISEIVLAAFEAAGYKKENVEISFMAWARAIDSTKKGKYHALMTAWYSEDRTKDFHYSLDPGIFLNRLGDKQSFLNFD